MACPGEDGGAVSTLAVAESGPCAGHPCDQCRTCQGAPPGGKTGLRLRDCPGQSARCCRRDNPEYRLPSEGDWDGPVYGDIGRLHRVGDTVECHACGEPFVSVAQHAWKTHDLTASEYKAIFGLKASTSLLGEALRANMRARMQGLIERGEITTIDQRPDDVPTPEQLSAYSTGRRRRREDQLHQQSPEVRARRGAAVSKALGGKKTRTCVVCGEQRQMYWANKAKTCGKTECSSVVRSQAMKGKPKSEEHRRKLSEVRRQMFADGRLVPWQRQKRAEQSSGGTSP